MTSLTQRILRIAGSTLLGLTAASLIASTAMSADPVVLKFTYWGSAFEKKNIEAAVESFNASHPNIRVEGQHIPGGSGYVEKLTTQLAAGDPPDVAYLGENQAFDWLENGTLLDLSKYFAGVEQDYVKNTIYQVGDKLLGTGLATGEILTYFNKDLFDAAGVAYPPSKASEAWTWPEFLETAQKLTKDSSGRNALDPAFDPENIQTYGVSFGTWWGTYLPFIFSNGGQFASEDGKELLLNKPEAVEALQNLQDLIYKYHVAPTPTQSKNLPSADILLQSGKVALAFDGMWKVTDFANLRFNWGLGVLPKLKEPATVIVSVPKVIFAATEHPDEVFEFYKFIGDPAQVKLFAEGLWAPHEKAYFTDEDKLATWLTAIPGVYPPEARDAIIDYTLNYAPNQPPAYWLRNYSQIDSKAITPAFDQLWGGTITAQEATDQAVEAAKPFLVGRY